MSSDSRDVCPAPRWLHAWAVFTVLATVCLLALGAVVTTFKVGMADKIWPTAPWALALIDWTEPNPGFVIEHSHRLAGYVVGFCSIVLMVGLLRQGQSRTLRTLGIAALAAVILQGVLGGFRVRLHEILGVTFSVVHGCFGQVVFSLLVAIALVTSTRFRRTALPNDEAPRLRGLSLLLTLAVLGQLVWGALLRHTGTPLAQRMHVLTAFLVVAVAAWLGRTAWDSEAARRRLGLPLGLLALLLTLQVLLGIEAYLGRFVGVLMPDLKPVTVPQAVVRIGHVLVGSWILASSVVLTLLSLRRPAEAAELEPAPAACTYPTTSQPLEGTA